MNDTIGLDYLRLRQVCLVAPELASAVGIVEDVLGLSVCHRAPQLAAYGLENAVFPVANRFLELVAPSHADAPANRFLARGSDRGGYMLIFDCHDPEVRRTRAEALGIRIAQRFDLPRFQGIHLHPRDCRAAMLEFDHSVDGEDADASYWPAGPEWQKHVDTRVTQRIAGVDMASTEPAGLAARWADIIGLPGARSADGAPLLEVDEQTLRFFQDTHDKRERFAAIRLEVRQPEAVLERAGTRGLATNANAFEFCGVSCQLTRSEPA